jgi:hypothetical protein
MHESIARDTQALGPHARCTDAGHPQPFGAQAWRQAVVVST